MELAKPSTSSSKGSDVKRLSFLGKSGPPGYVAGVGRGATGFTTRSDIGPARTSTSKGAAPSTSSAAAAAEDAAEDEYLNESNYDEFAGYGGSLFNRDPYEEDDQEADKIYDEIEKRLDERGKALREAKARQQIEEYRQKRPKIQQQFMDLKAGLKQVSEEEWMSIPEVGDARNRKQRVARQDKFTPVPDSLLAHQAEIASGGEKVVYIDPITEMSEFRSSYMSMQLSSKSNLTQSETVNPQDYLTNLQANAPRQITDEGTLKEYRKQFESLRKSNPSFPNAWIASIRLEEAAGKLKAARTLALKACEKCPNSADLWCEAARLHPLDMAKSIMVQALKENPRSEKLWIKAADLETDESAKRRVFAKARGAASRSALLWKKSIELEPPEGARVLLEQAVERCPNDVDLQLALARLQPYERAQMTLIEASKRNPTERSIWIAAAKLEEAAGNKSLVSSIIKRAIEEISSKGVEVKRDEWLQEAVDADTAELELTCHEIVRHIIGWNLGDKSEDEKLKLCLGDAQKFIANKSINCARGVFLAIVSDKAYCRMESVWLKYADFEQQHGNCVRPSSSGEAEVQVGKLNEPPECAVLRQAVRPENCIKSETLWLKLANSKRDQLDESRQIFVDALDANPDSERLLIAAVELECDNGEFAEARRILEVACKSAKTRQLVKKAAQLERSLGNVDEAIARLKDAITDYKDYPDFYLMLGQMEEQRDNIDKARTHYSDGLKFCPTSVELWIALAGVEERSGSLARARSKLEMARLRNPKVVLLYLESARLELRAYLARRRASGGNQLGGRPDAALTILAKGIRECKGAPDHSKLVEEQEMMRKS